MNADRLSPSWMPRPPVRWSMPVSLQPRAARQCRIVQADDKRPVRRSRLGYHVRPNGSYQLEVAAAEESHLPRNASIVSGPMRRTNDQEQRTTRGGGACCRFDLALARDDDGLRLPRCWWSRLERLTVRLEYDDGREDLEQMFWLVVTPRRIWALLALVTSAILYGLVPWLSRIMIEGGNLPQVWSRVLTVLSPPTVWAGLMLVILGLWLAVVASDRLQLWFRWLRVRREARREVQHYLQLAERRYLNVNSNVPM